MSLNKKLYLKLSFVIVLLLSCSESSQNGTIVKDPSSKTEIVAPIQQKNNTSTYRVSDFTFTLSSSFIIRNSKGYHGEMVYSIKYPAGISGAVELSNRPKINGLLAQLIMPEYVNHSTQKKDHPLNESIDSLYENGKYYHEYQNKELENDNQSVSAYVIEAKCVDSTFIWYHYPNANNYGKIDIILDKNEVEGEFVHIFANSNKYLSYEQIRQFAHELLGMKNTPQQ